ncbi:Imm26 family immunity protein [Paenibacillus sp. Marseille-Q7038]
MILSKDTHKHITIGHMTLFIPDYELERYLLITTIANQFGVQTNTQAGLLLLDKIRGEEEGLLDQLTFEYDDGGIIVHSSEAHAEAILQVIFLAHDLMVPPYQINLSNEEKNRAIDYCKKWVRPTPQKWKIGDVFTIPLMNEDYAYGQVVKETTEKNPVCVLYECCSEEVLEPSYVITQRPIAIISVLGDQIHNFTFQVIGNAPVLVTGEEESEHPGSKVKRFSDSFLTQLANAYHGLTEWDDPMQDNEAFLLPGVDGPYDNDSRPIPNKVVDVIPGERIGKLYLGMSEKECRAVLESYRKEHLKGLWNYSFNDVFRIDYDQEGKSSFIEMVTGYEPELLQVRIHLPEQTVDAFHTKAKMLIPIIDKVSPYDRSEEDNGYAYYFKELGLALWRGNVLEEEQIEEAWYKEMCAENQQDELRFMYFETVSVMVPDYYNPS